ncbi:MAG TPA: T9SS type A sorting domain-containing protein [Candidatus Kryptonia bacterium]
MVRRLVFLLGLVMVVGFGSADAQWTFTKVFPDNSFNPTPISGSGINNCITVDPMGRIWMASYRYADSLMRSDGTKIPVERIYCYNPDGSQASFSPMSVLQSKDGTIKDTLSAVTMSGSYTYGMTTGPDGNIFFAGTSYWLYEIDYHDGTEIAKIKNPIPGYASSITTPMLDAAGDVFLTSVSPTYTVGPIALASDFSSVITSVDTSMWGFYSRNVSVTSDGNDVFVHHIAQGTFHYHSGSGSLGPYALADTVFDSLVVESSAWQPGTGRLWVSSGNVTSGMPGAPYSGYAWYGFDMTNPSHPVLKDSLLWYGATGLSGDSIKNDPRPRGIAFSVTGDTAYVAAFNVSGPGAVEMFTGPATAVNEPPHGPSSYSLSQNYPNPFNPSTKIDFTLKSNTKVTLKVYDILGREVTTLVNGRLTAGEHSATFNASNLASGVYIYSLVTSDGFKITKKMILMK